MSECGSAVPAPGSSGGESACPAAVARRQRCDPLTARRRLLDAIRHLSEEERLVLSRAYGAGWTVDEIAERQSLPAELIRRRLHDALRRLRMLTDDDDPGAVGRPPSPFGHR